MPPNQEEIFIPLLTSYASFYAIPMAKQACHQPTTLFLLFRASASIPLYAPLLLSLLFSANYRAGRRILSYAIEFCNVCDIPKRLPSEY